MGQFGKTIRRLKSDKSGNMALIVALAMPALIGGAGFAVDTAQWYLWKQELQHSVDQAAYAGAWAKASPASGDLYERRALQEFNANLNVTKDFASAPTVKLGGYAGGSNNSVIVTATATKSLPFSSFLIGKSTTVFVRAQAIFAKGFDFTACLTSTATDGTGTLVTGSAKINAKCGFAALSCDKNAIEINGAAKILTESMVACGTITSNGTVSNGEDKDEEDIVTEGITTLKDIYADLSPPDDPTTQTYRCTGNGNKAQASLVPGTYSSLVVSCTTVLASGIYVINGGLLDLSTNDSVTGRGVMFVLRNGAQLRLGGSGGTGTLNLTPPTEADLLKTPAAANAKRLAGILIFEERREDGDPEVTHVMNGNSRSVIEGLIYLPANKLQINGTADVASQCLQITAYRLEILGNADITTLCPPTLTNSVGSGKPDVRLVA